MFWRSVILAKTLRTRFIERANVDELEQQIAQDAAEWMRYGRARIRANYRKVAHTVTQAQFDRILAVLNNLVVDNRVSGFDLLTALIAADVDVHAVEL